MLDSLGSYHQTFTTYQHALLTTNGQPEQSVIRQMFLELREIKQHFKMAQSLIDGDELTVITDTLLGLLKHAGDEVASALLETLHITFKTQVGRHSAVVHEAVEKFESMAGFLPARQAIQAQENRIRKWATMKPPPVAARPA